MNFGGETFLYFNKSNELCIYDKTEESKRKNILIPPRIMRYENRIMNRKSLLNKFKHTIAANNVLSVQNLMRFDVFKTEMINLGNQIFDKKKIDVELIDENNFRMMLLQIKETNRFWLRDFFYREGMNTVLNNVDKNILLPVLKDLLIKSQYYKIKKEIENFSFSQSIFNKIETANLFDEMKNKYFENLKKVA